MPGGVYEFPPEGKRSFAEQSFFCMLLARGYREVEKGDRVLLVRATSPEIDPQARETLKKLGAPPCRIRVEKDEQVPEQVIKHWREKGIEVDPLGVIRARFRGSKREYIYPYRVRDERERITEPV